MRKIAEVLIYLMGKKHKGEFILFLYGGKRDGRGEGKREGTRAWGAGKGETIGKSLRSRGMGFSHEAGGGVNVKRESLAYREFLVEGTKNFCFS